jgi:hypothetical protein
MDTHSLADTIALLQRTPATFNALLRDLPDTWARRNEGADTWTAFDVIGHLVHGERTDWMPRLYRILQDGESKAFDPFDRFAQTRESEGKSLPELLDEFAALRAGNLQQLKSLDLKSEDLERRGRHPALGVVTLGNLLSTWAAHDMTHLHQVSRILAHQKRTEVGPWSKFLGVLQCSGHSA